MTITFRCDLSVAPSKLSHSWERCVGSGHATLALRADWQQQLRRAHAELGMETVRFHGLLSDDMGTLECQQGQLLYSFFNLDRIIDFLLEIGMRPFIELGFMPEALASGSTTVFHYAANVTPPKDHGQWRELLTRLARHLLARYGADEVCRWQFEVWNEPNQPQFWPAGRDAYFRLYDASYDALKSVEPRLRVGGPASSKNAWLPEFLAHCRDGARLPDFVSTHHYPTDAFGAQSDDTVEQLAHAGRSALREQARVARGQVGALPLCYTEWCTSSNPRDPLHDQPYAAAYIVKTALEADPLVDAYSYWTFSDIFEENYFPSQPFHGGFGLLNLQGVAKPAYRAFELLHAAGDQMLPVAGQHDTVDVWVTRSATALTVLLSNGALPRQPIGEHTVRVALAALPSAPGPATLRRVDATHANAPAAWRAMGEPEYLSAEQLAALHNASQLSATTLDCQYEAGGDGGGTLAFTVTLTPQSVAMVTLPLTAGVASDAAPDRASAPSGPEVDADTAMLADIQRETFAYFLHECNQDNGLVADSTQPGAPCSIAATGMALSCYPVAVERGYMSRSAALARTLTTLRFFERSRQDGGGQASGHRGFYYHFLDMGSGARAQSAELSSIDTALLVAGMLTAAAYFDADNDDERAVRTLADALYQRVDWPWMQAGGAALCHGWRPEAGFLDSRWQGYSEALLLYILGLGSNRHPLPADSYQAWCAAYQWARINGHEVLYGGPLFVHQLSQVWLDLRGVRDRPMRQHDSDYFENSRRSTLIQQRHAIDNPGRYRGYGAQCWGFSAGDGPGPRQQQVAGVDRLFHGYLARGAPFGPEDGTIIPATAAAALPFAPEIVLPTLRHCIDAVQLKPADRYGFAASFNAEFQANGQPGANPHGWVSEWHYGLNQGPVVLMIENHRSGLIWRLLRASAPIARGLRRAGFDGGWLGAG